ncbi:hypothetical protein FB451DRAFT_1149174 [Mycena latifolia]|nr:hypothetical protein FB451DRAFT_1149174 [Mycena latifolia]
MPQSHLDNVRASVADLLLGAHSYPCSAAAPAFARLAQSIETSNFQLALDALLPVLDLQTTSERLTDRILASFLLFSLYSSHPVSMNPFKSSLLKTLVRERDKAREVTRNGGVASNEPLVWVLWKILKGDGDDLGPYSPNTLARSAFPPDFKVTTVIFVDIQYQTRSDLNEITYLDGAQVPSDAHESVRIIAREEDEPSATIAHATRLFLAARTRVLSLAEQRQLALHLPALAASNPALLAPADVAPLTAHNPALAGTFFSALLTRRAPAPASFLSALTSLPPTLPTFDVLGRLLRDPDPGVSALVRTKVLGPFIHGAVEWLDRAEEEEREGRVSDDRFGMGVQRLCRFCTSLINLGLVDPANDADTAAMAHFSLQNARVAEANALYKVLAGARGEV